MYEWAAAIPNEKPKKPLSFFFKFRKERLVALKGQENLDKIIKEEWKNMPVAQKDAED